MTYKKNDMVVVFGGTQNMGKNNSILDIYSLTHFMKRSNNTKVIAICHPLRYDMSSSSCVNKKVIRYQVKLWKTVQSFSHVQVINMSSNRNHFTRQDLHLNTLAKDSY